MHLTFIIFSATFDYISTQIEIKELELWLIRNDIIVIVKLFKRQKTKCLL